MQHQSGAMVPLGDLIQKIASDVSRSLMIVLEALPAQTPELRFEKMKACIARMKKELCQLLAILMWLRDENAQKFFQSMGSVESDIRTREMQLNGVQDSFFFLHQSIYKRRRRALDVTMASDIMARGTYAHLPLSIFRFDPNLSSALAETKIDTVSPGVREELNMFIGCKLCLEEQVTPKIDELSIVNGNLIMKKSNFFEVTQLTLVEPSETAKWTVSGIHFCIEHRENHGFVDTYEHLNLENNIKKSLNNLLATSPEKGGRGHSGNILDLVYHVCQHVSLSALLKLVFIQGLHYCRHYGEGFSEVRYTEESTRLCFEYSFWASTKFRFETCPYLLRISLPRVVMVDECQLELFRVLDPSAQGSAPICIPMKVSADAMSGILHSMSEPGASFETVAAAVHEICAQERLNLVFTLLSRTPLFSEQKIFHIKRDTDGLTFQLCCGSSHYIGFCVNALTGKFIAVNASSSWGLVGGAKDSLLLFLGEINGIVSDLITKKVRNWDEALERYGRFEFKTLSMVLRYFLLFDIDSDVGVIVGTGHAMPGAWINRLARSSELDQNACSMYFLSRTTESKQNLAVSNTNRGLLTPFEVIISFVVSVSESLVVSYHIISSFRFMGKDDLPPSFVELYNFPRGMIIRDPIINKNESVVLSSLHRCDLFSPLSIGKHIGELYRVRLTLSLLKAEESPESLSQQFRYRIAASVPAFLEMDKYLLPLYRLLEERRLFILSPLEDALSNDLFGRSKEWSVSCCAVFSSLDGTNCKIFAAVNSGEIVLFLNVVDTENSDIEEGRLLAAFSHESNGGGDGAFCWRMRAHATDEWYFLSDEMPNAVLCYNIMPRFQKCRTSSQQQIVDISIVENKWLAITLKASARIQGSSIFNTTSISEAYYSLINCCNNLGYVKNRILGTANERMLGSTSRCSPVSIGLLDLNIDIQPLNVTIDYNVNSVTGASDNGNSGQSICRAVLQYALFLPLFEAARKDRPAIHPFELVCTKCTADLPPAHERTFYDNSRYHLIFCESLLNSALSASIMAMVDLDIVGTNITGLLCSTSAEAIPAILLTWHVVQKSKNAFSIRYFDIFSSGSFSLVVWKRVELKCEALCHVSVDVVKTRNADEGKGALNSGSFYQLRVDPFDKSKASVTQLNGTDPLSCAEYIVHRISEIASSFSS